MRQLIALAMVGLLAGCAMNGHCEKKEKEEGNEQKVAFANVPQAAQATLTKEAGGNKIDRVDKEMHHGKTCYEADTMMNGKNYEIVVAEDGTLISKKLDMEEGEKDEHHDKDKDHDKDEDEKNEKK